MTASRQHVCAVVVGAGAGGLFTAARLAKAGYRALVVERLDKVGGRASTGGIDGFTRATPSQPSSVRITAPVIVSAARRTEEPTSTSGPPAPWH